MFALVFTAASYKSEGSSSNLSLSIYFNMKSCDLNIISAGLRFGNTHLNSNHQASSWVYVEINAKHAIDSEK